MELGFAPRLQAAKVADPDYLPGQSSRKARGRLPALPRLPAAPAMEEGPPDARLSAANWRKPRTARLQFWSHQVWKHEARLLPSDSLDATRAVSLLMSSMSCSLREALTLFPLCAFVCNQTVHCKGCLLCCSFR